jgi:hypothetical protein
MTELRPDDGGPAASRTAEAISAMAERTAETARGIASDFVGEVKDAANALLNEQKDRAAETVGNVASALRQTAQQLHEENPAVARYAERAADRVDLFSDAVRERPLGEMIGDIDGFARRSPAVFLVGAVAAGFLVGRVIAASSERRPEAAAHGSRPDDRNAASDARRLYAGGRGMAGYGAAATTGKGSDSDDQGHA